MFKPLTFALLAAAAAMPTASYAQVWHGVGADFYHLVANRLNNLVLLGDWAPADKAKWQQTLDTGGIFEYGFKLLDRQSYRFTLQGHYGDNVESFERWVLQFSGAPATAKWIALDMDGRLIGHGARPLGAKEFEALLDSRGIESPQKIIRAFLQRHPGHINAMSDYLKEVRRRALMRVPAAPAAGSDSGQDTGQNTDQDKDLGKEADLRTWGVLAAEVDRIFNDEWLGIELDFFRPEREQPEIHSPLMRAAFRKHIPKVEAALREQPENYELWDIWGWMACGIGDYSGATRFVRSLDAPLSAKVALWLLNDAYSKSDWVTVAEFGERAGYYSGVGRTTQKSEWIPGGAQGGYVFGSAGIRGWPVKSAYVPHFEALLRLGRIDEANALFDEMILRLGAEFFGLNYAKMAADAARSAGMENIAKIWEQGELINKVPHIPLNAVWRRFYVLAEQTDEYYKEFQERASKLDPQIGVAALYGEAFPRWGTLGWKADDGHRWALIGDDKKVAAEGRSIPDIDQLQGILNRHIKNDIAESRKFVQDHPERYDSMLKLAFNLIGRNYRYIQDDNETAPLSADQDEALWGEAARLLNRVLINAPHLLIDLPFIAMPPAALARSSMLKALSARFLPIIESNLERKQSTENLIQSLWFQWVFWRAAEGESRPLRPIVERAVPSPFAMPGTVPPSFVLDDYYNECRQAGAWPQVIELLTVPWDREILRIDEDKLKNSDSKFQTPKFGDSVVLPLIEALLNEGKASRADDVFTAWTNRGGTFEDAAKLLELAKTLGSDSLARDWGNKLPKASPLLP